MKHTILVFCAMSLGLPFMGCEDDKGEESASKPIGFVPGAPAEIDGFFAAMIAGAESKAAELGVELLVRPSESWDPTLQKPIVEGLVKEGAGVIIIQPTANMDGVDMVEPLRAANKAGVKIITIDTFIGNNTYGQGGTADFPLSFIGSNNEEGGKIGCDGLADAVGGAGKVLVVGEMPDASASSIHDREQGCRDNLADIYPDIEVLNPAREELESGLQPGDWGRAMTEKYLESDPDLKGVFAINFLVGEGVAQALLDAGLEDTIRIIVFDCSQASAALIHEGKVYGCVAQRPNLMGETSVEFARNAMEGKTDLPTYVSTGFVVLNQENIDDPEMALFVYGATL